MYIKRVEDNAYSQYIMTYMYIYSHPLAKHPQPWLWPIIMKSAILGDLSLVIIALYFICLIHALV